MRSLLQFCLSCYSSTSVKLCGVIVPLTLLSSVILLQFGESEMSRALAFFAKGFSSTLVL